MLVLRFDKRDLFRSRSSLKLFLSADRVVHRVEDPKIDELGAVILFCKPFDGARSVLGGAPLKVARNTNVQDGVCSVRYNVNKTLLVAHKACFVGGTLLAMTDETYLCKTQTTPASNRRIAVSRDGRTCRLFSKVRHGFQFPQLFRRPKQRCDPPCRRLRVDEQ